jgi:archaellin
LNGKVFSTGRWNETNESFGILVLQDGDNSITSSAPVMNSGDVVMLCVNANSCFSGLNALVDVWGKVIPESGSPGIFAFRVPALLTATVYDLY